MNVIFDVSLSLLNGTEQPSKALINSCIDCREYVLLKVILSTPTGSHDVHYGPYFNAFREKGEILLHL